MKHVPVELHEEVIVLLQSCDQGIPVPRSQTAHAVCRLNKRRENEQKWRSSDGQQ